MRLKSDSAAAHTVGGHGYCLVTVVSGARRVDVALPSSIPCTDLLPGLLRLVHSRDEPPGGETHGGETHGGETHGGVKSSSDTRSRETVRSETRSDETNRKERFGGSGWMLIPVGRRPLAMADTLAQAGVLNGDVVSLEPAAADGRDSGRLITSARDRVEEVIDRSGRFWDPAVSRRFAMWTFVVIVAALLIPMTSMPMGLPASGLAATVAVIIAAITALGLPPSETRCAAMSLFIGAVWAAIAGAALLNEWAPGMRIVGMTVSPALTAVAGGSALLLVAGVCGRHPVAVVYALALLVVVGSSAVVMTGRWMGAPLIETGAAVAVLAVTMVGLLPRVAVAVADLSGVVGLTQLEADRRIVRADLLLTGCIVGVCAVAVIGGIPAALSTNGWCRLLAAGIALLLLLRARAFTRVHHMIGPLTAGLVVLAGSWSACSQTAPQLQPPLILGAAAVAAVVAAAATMRTAGSAVGRARIGRWLNAAEQLLVVGVIVLAAGVLGLFPWMSAVLG